MLSAGHAVDLLAFMASQAGDKVRGLSKVASKADEVCGLLATAARQPDHRRVLGLAGELYTRNYIYKALNKLLQEVDAAKLSAEARAVGEHMWEYVVLLEIFCLRAEPYGASGAGSVRLWRGVQGRGKRIAEAYAEQKGKLIVWPNFTSTTAKESVAREMAGEGGVVFDITIPREALGLRALGGVGMKEWSELAGEEEVLLAPAVPFKVMEVRKESPALVKLLVNVPELRRLDRCVRQAIVAYLGLEVDEQRVRRRDWLGPLGRKFDSHQLRDREETMIAQEHSRWEVDDARVSKQRTKLEAQHMQANQRSPAVGLYGEDPRGKSLPLAKAKPLAGAPRKAERERGLAILGDGADSGRKSHTLPATARSVGGAESAPAAIAAAVQGPAAGKAAGARQARRSLIPVPKQNPKVHVKVLSLPADAEGAAAPAPKVKGAAQRRRLETEEVRAREAAAAVEWRARVELQRAVAAQNRG